RALRSGHRHPAEPRPARGARGKTRGDLAVLQPAAALDAGGAVQRRALRVQGEPRRRGPPAAAARSRHRLGLRHRTAGPGRAIRADAARRLLPHVADTGWFFDTELLVLAERSGMRIHEVPVDWVDDPDSRVDLLATAVADLKGIVRLATGLARGDIPVPAITAQFGHRAGPPRSLLGQAVRFAVIGVLSTLAYLAL